MSVEGGGRGEMGVVLRLEGLAVSLMVVPGLGCWVELVSWWRNGVHGGLRALQELRCRDLLGAWRLRELEGS